MGAIAETFAELATEWQAAQVPYRHRGYLRTGCDCTGLIIGCLREMGYLRAYVLRRYPRDWNLHAGAGDYIRQEIVRVADEIPREDVGRGDIVLMNFGRCTAHAGIVLDYPVFVHALSTNRQVSAGILHNSPWSKRWTSTWRLSSQKLQEQRNG